MWSLRLRTFAVPPSLGKVTVPTEFRDARGIAMTADNRISRSPPYLDSRATSFVVCVTAALSYLVPKLAALLISNPKTVWPLWPGCAILVTGLLLVRVSVWPLLIPASFVGFAFADLQAGVPLSSIAWFIPGNTVEVLIAAISPTQPSLPNTSHRSLRTTNRLSNTYLSFECKCRILG